MSPLTSVLILQVWNSSIIQTNSILLNHPNSGTGKWPMSMQNLSPKKRGCRFKQESGSLLFHKEYSRTNCRFECGFTRAAKDFGCVPWYLPHDFQKMVDEKPCRWSFYNTVYLSVSSCSFPQHCQNCRLHQHNGRGGKQVRLPCWMRRHRIPILSNLNLD